MSVLPQNWMNLCVKLCLLRFALFSVSQLWECAYVWRIFAKLEVSIEGLDSSGRMERKCLCFIHWPLKKEFEELKTKDFSSLVEAACSIIIYFLQNSFTLGKSKQKLFRFLKYLFMFIWSCIYNYWWRFVYLPLLSKFLCKNVCIYQIGSNRCVTAHECV